MRNQKAPSPTHRSDGGEAQRNVGSGGRDKQNNNETQSNSQERRRNRWATSKTPVIKPDLIHPGMWRLQYPDGRLSDMVNLTRAKDAKAAFEARGFVDQVLEVGT